MDRMVARARMAHAPQHGQVPGTGRTARVALWGLPTSETCARYAPVPGGQSFGIRNAAPRASGRSCTCGVQSIDQDGLCTAVEEQCLSSFRVFSGKSRMRLALTTTHENSALQRSVVESLVKQNADLHMFSRTTTITHRKAQVV
jgi:hypothetical protein